MTVRISVAHNEARLAGTKAHIEAGAADSRLMIYSGSKPTVIGGALTGQVLLADFVLPLNVGTVADNKLTLATIPEVLVLANGTAAWARFVNGNGDIALDCDVTGIGGGGEIQMSAVNLFAGGTARVSLAILR